VNPIGRSFSSGRRICCRWNSNDCDRRLPPPDGENPLGVRELKMARVEAQALAFNVGVEAADQWVG